MSEKNWQSQETFLRDLIVFLETYLKPDSSPKGQLQLNQTLEQWKRLGDFNLYLAVVFSSKELFGTCTLIPVRTVSGLLLKNNLALMKESSHGEQVQTLYQMALSCLNDENTLIRSTAGSLVSSLVSIFGLDVCPTLFMTLADIVANSSQTNPIVAESALSTFQKICEDSSHDLWMHHAELVNFLIPKLLEWISVLSLSQSHYCITMINQFIIYKPDTLSSHLTEFIGILALKASEASKEDVSAQLSELFAKLVCQSLVLLLDAYLHEMTPMLPSIMEYMLSLLSGNNLPVALEACEFWLSLSHHADALNITILEGILPRLITSLLTCMVYEPDDVVFIENSKNENSYVPDNKTEIFPRHYHHAQQRQNQASFVEPKTSSTFVPAVLEEGEMDDDDDTSLLNDDDDDREEDEEASNWNLRKCAASCLDSFSLVLSESQFNTILMPNIISFLQQADWLKREVGILSLGAIYSGCYTLIKPHLAAVMPSLVSQLRDEMPLIRSITCWTLNRYIPWMIDMFVEGNIGPYQETLKALLIALTDGNKRVQGSALSALSALFEKSPPNILEPYLDPVVTAIASCFQSVQKKNGIVMFDALSSLASNVGTKLCRPQWFSALLPLIMDRWDTLMDEDQEIFPLMECLVPLILCFGDLMVNAYGPLLYDRCLRNLRIEVSDNVVESFDYDLCVSSIELLSSLCQVMPKEAFYQLIQSHSIPLQPLFISSLRHSSLDIRQSGFALFGDFCKHDPELLVGHFPSFLPMFMDSMNPDSEHSNTSIANNVAWSLGEFSLISPTEIEPVVDLFCPFYIQCLVKDYAPYFVDNVAVSLGRLALASPSKAGNYLISVLPQWIETIQNVKDKREVETALDGFFAAISHHASSNHMALSNAESLFLVIKLITIFYTKHGCLPTEKYKEALKKVMELVSRTTGNSISKLQEYLKTRLPSTDLLYHLFNSPI